MTIDCSSDLESAEKSNQQIQAMIYAWQCELNQIRNRQETEESNG
jgi:hypothetical protein